MLSTTSFRSVSSDANIFVILSGKQYIQKSEINKRKYSLFSPEAYLIPFLAYVLSGLLGPCGSLMRFRRVQVTQVTVHRWLVVLLFVNDVVMQLIDVVLRVLACGVVRTNRARILVDKRRQIRVAVVGGAVWLFGAVEVVLRWSVGLVMLLIRVSVFVVRHAVSIGTAVLVRLRFVVVLG